ncbi:unnamed protein product [Mytilus coruscus]|uniref:C-type lectin domain-containing protein n=1 Tax=Mytilus coruscus TaxID=42192 RepID=A0A6J8EZ73_MYTCO|nr:unnamed protein product [Mytilus coruscus]
MSYVCLFINAIVVALMAIYVYENERRIWKISTKHDRTDMFVNAILMSCCSTLISAESCLGSEDESLLSGTCIESTLQTLETRLKALDNSFWLGAADFTEGDWTWTVDFSQVTFTDWHSGQPDNAAGNEDCLHIEKTLLYKWNDIDCNTYMAYICESEKGEARIPYSRPFPR